MELEPERPPAYVNTPPHRIAWPSIPQHAPHHHPSPADITLPDLKTVLSSDFEPRSPPQTIPNGPSYHHYNNHHLHNPLHPSSRSPPSLPPIEAGHGYIHDAGLVSPIGSASVMSKDDHVSTTSVVSMDDPDVRIAAEALSGLGNAGAQKQTSLIGGNGTLTGTAGFARSPRPSAGPMQPPYSRNSQSQAQAQAHVQARDMQQVEQEPLLELVAQAHPWVGGTIKGSLSAYSTTKHYSPRIVQYGANLVERNITIPVVSAVSSVGEMTGVELNLRRYLDSRRSTELESDNPAKRKHILDAPADLDIAYMDASKGLDLRRDSVESRPEPLPRYGASRPPSYREEDPALSERLGRDVVSRTRPSNNRSWSSQFLVTTSGLSVALSTTSRRSLRYCLGLLGQSADRVSDLTTALSLILRDYERARASQQDSAASALEKGERPPTPAQDDAARHLARAIKQHSDDIWQILRHVVNSVSNYAGGALPENARQFVRQQLMSLPQRWRVVSDGQSGESETTRSAQRMIDFAREGLDMMTQVSGVLKATLESAEKWLERVGRRDPRHDEEDQPMTDAPWQQPVNYDEKV